MELNNICKIEPTYTTVLTITMEQWNTFNSEFQELKKIIQQQQEQINQLAKPKQETGYLSTKEAKKYLGNISQKTWQTYRDKHFFPFAKIDGKILVKKEDLDKFMEKHYVRENDDMLRW